MATNRKEFLSILNKVKPALGGRNELAGLDSLWFTDNYVHAYNGVIRIQAPCISPILGGVSGDLLIKFLASVGTEEINIKSGKGYTVKGGNASLTLPTLDLDKTVCEFPVIDTSSGEKLESGFFNALDRCTISINKNSARESYSGIMIEQIDGGINLFSTDNKALTWEQIKHPSFDNWEPRLLLPGEFCTQLLRLADDDTVFLSDEGYAAISTVEGLSLTTRLLDAEGAPQYARVVRRHLDSIEQYYPIPDNLRSALERCELVKPDRGEDPVILDIKDGTLNISISTTLGQASDQIEIDHPDIRVIIDSGLILRAIENYTEFAITKDAFILHGEGTSYHLISTMNS